MGDKDFDKAMLGVALIVCLLVKYFLF